MLVSQKTALILECHYSCRYFTKPLLEFGTFFEELRMALYKSLVFNVAYINFINSNSNVLIIFREFEKKIILRLI